MFSVALLFSSLLLGRCYWWFYPKEEAQFIAQQQYDLEPASLPLELIGDDIQQRCRECLQPELIQALQQGKNLPSIIEKTLGSWPVLLIVDRSMEVSFYLRKIPLGKRGNRRGIFLSWLESYTETNRIF